MNRIQAIVKSTIIAAAMAGIVFAKPLLAEDGNEGPSLQYAAAEQIATLENEDVRESSGLVASRRSPGIFWTHNDSGDAAQIFAFDEQGRHVGACKIEGAQAIDWEDIASFTVGDQHWLVLCDVGDNARRRKKVRLDFLREPTPTAKSAKVEMTVHFRYPRKPRDCEAVAIDPHSKTILIVVKSVTPPSVFALPLPAESPKETLVAKKIGRIAVPLVTGMDISHDGRRLALATYGSACMFARKNDESWQAALQRPPHILNSPQLRQGEAICFGHDNYSLYLTSERLPTPLWKLEAAE